MGDKKDDQVGKPISMELYNQVRRAKGEVVFDFSRIQPFRDLREQDRQRGYAYRASSHRTVGWDTPIPTPKPEPEESLEPEVEILEQKVLGPYDLNLHEAMGLFDLDGESHDLSTYPLEPRGRFIPMQFAGIRVPQDMRRAMSKAKSVIKRYMKRQLMMKRIASVGMFSNNSYVIPLEDKPVRKAIRVPSIFCRLDTVVDKYQKSMPEFLSTIMFEDPHDKRFICQLVNHAQKNNFNPLDTMVLRLDVFYDTPNGVKHFDVYDM